jgi:hypothetical protein
VRRALLLAAILAAALAAPAAEARDPGRWLLTGWSSVPLKYWQGVTGDRSGRLFFDGPFEGLYGATRSLRETTSLPQAIPLEVRAAEGYNHIGDIGWDAAERGRLLLPLECYDPIRAVNTCATGSIGVADPATLAWRYYVKLDPAEIPKAMWVEPDPAGRLLWTSSGDDLLAYRARDVTLAQAPPAPPIRSVRRLRRAVPPSGITGAAFQRGRLFLAGQGAGFQIWSVHPEDGRRRLEVDLGDRISGEAEGLHVTRLLGGELHFLIAGLPMGGRPLTFGPESALLHFARDPGRPGLRVAVRARAAVAGRTRMSVRVLRRGRPVRGAVVRFAGRRARTDRGGRATVTASFERDGEFAVLVTKGRLRGLSRRVTVRGG